MSVLWVALCVFAVARGSDDAVAVEDPEAIVGGDFAKPFAWPWYATVHTADGTLIGGATLVSKKKVVTTVVNAINDAFFVRLGVSDVNDLSFAQLKTIDRVDLHPENNIAILILSEKVNITKAVQQIPRISTRQVDKKAENNPKCSVIGFGYMLKGGKWSLSEKLMERYTKTFDSEKCGYLLGATIGENRICTKRKKGGICFGDFGGPYQCNIDGTWTLVGIGEGFNQYEGCRGGLRFYQRASYYKSWINASRAS